MGTYVWATPREAREYYLDYAGRTDADLWHAVHDGHIRVSIMDVEFSGDQIRALLKLTHWDVPEDQREFILPRWMAVHVDDVQRVLCGERMPEKRRGRPKRTSDQARRDYSLAVRVSKLIGSGDANSVAEAARILIDQNEVDGASVEAKEKKVQRVYSRHFRHD